MTGVMLAAEAKKARPDMPVIIATGYAELPQDTFGLVKLNKPYFQSDLSHAIDVAVAKKL